MEILAAVDARPLTQPGAAEFTTSMRSSWMSTAPSPPTYKTQLAILAGLANKPFLLMAFCKASAGLILFLPVTPIPGLRHMKAFFEVGLF